MHCETRLKEREEERKEIGSLALGLVLDELLDHVAVRLLERRELESELLLCPRRVKLVQLGVLVDPLALGLVDLGHLDLVSEALGGEGSYLFVGEGSSARKESSLCVLLNGTNVYLCYCPHIDPLRESSVWDRVGRAVDQCPDASARRVELVQLLDGVDSRADDEWRADGRELEVQLVLFDVVVGCLLGHLLAGTVDVAWVTLGLAS